MAVIINRARRQNFEAAFGYDGYNDPKDHRGDIPLDEVDENGQRHPTAPRRIYVV